MTAGQRQPHSSLPGGTLLELVTKLVNENRLERIATAGFAVQQRLELARTNWERAQDVARTRPTDYDFQFQTMYTALIDGANALVTALGFRVHGTDMSHMILFGLAGCAIEPRAPEIAQRLSRINEQARRIRSEVTYNRVGVVSKQDRDRFFDDCSQILEELEQFTCRQSNLPIPGHSWSNPLSGPS